MTNYQLKSNGAPNTFENLLTDWGRLQRQTPPHNEILRTQILAGISPQPAAQMPAAPKINFAWLSLALAGFAVATFFIIPTLHTAQPISQTGTSFISSSAPAVDKSDHAMPNPMRENVGALRLSSGAGVGANSYKIWPEPPISNPAAPSSDTREFLKTDYSASIQTRNVQDLAGRIQTTVRGFGGRVDSGSNSAQSGFISFVVPAGQFEAFRQQIKGLVNYRFYSETTQTQNLLPQKRDIEDQQNQTNSTLTQLQSDKNQLTQNHSRTAASLNLQIRAAGKKLADLQNQITTDVNLALQIEAQKKDLAIQIKNLRNRLSVENYNYSNQLDSLNSQIQDQQNILDNLNAQTNNLLDNVATVNGSISLNWISLWSVFNLYVSSGYWAPGLLLILAVAAYWISRKQSQIILP